MSSYDDLIPVKADSGYEDLIPADPYSDLIPKAAPGRIQYDQNLSELRQDERGVIGRTIDRMLEAMPGTRRFGMGVKEGITAEVPKQVGGFMNLLAEMTSNAKGTPGAWAPSQGDTEALPNWLRQRGDEFAKGGQAISAEAHAMGQQVGGGETGRKLQELGSSASSMLPIIPAAAIGGVPASVGASFIQSAGGTFTDAVESYMKQGLTEAEAKQKAVAPAFLSGVSTAMFTAGFGATGIEAIKNGKLPEGMKGKMTEFLKEAGFEVVEEGGDQAWQSVLGQLTYRPDMSGKEALDEIINAGVAGGIIGGMAQGARAIPGIIPSPKPQSKLPAAVAPAVEQAKVYAPESARAAELAAEDELPDVTMTDEAAIQKATDELLAQPEPMTPVSMETDQPAAVAPGLASVAAAEAGQSAPVIGDLPEVAPAPAQAPSTPISAPAPVQPESPVSAPVPANTQPVTEIAGAEPTLTESDKAALLTDPDLNPVEGEPGKVVTENEQVQMQGQGRQEAVSPQPAEPGVATAAPAPAPAPTPASPLAPAAAPVGEVGPVAKAIAEENKRILEELKLQLKSIAQRRKEVRAEFKGVKPISTMNRTTPRIERGQAFSRALNNLDFEENRVRGHIAAIEKQSKPTPAPVAPAVTPTPAAQPTATATQVQVEKPKPPVSQQKQAPSTATLKEQKKFLLSEVDSAIKEAPEVAEVVPNPEIEADIETLKAAEDLDGNISGKLMEKYGLGVPDVETSRWELKEKTLPILASLMKPRVTIDIPGDGTFSIINSKEALRAFKEQAKSFPATPARPFLSESQKRMEPTNPPAVNVKHTVEGDIAVANEFVSTEDTRFAITMPFTDGSHIVGTDGRMMVIVDRKGLPGTPKKMAYLDAKGKQITDFGNNDEGKPIKPEAPNFKQVLPDVSGDTPALKGLDTARLFSLIKQALAIFDQEQLKRIPSIRIQVDAEGRLGISARTAIGDEYASGITDDPKLVVAVDPVRLLKLVGAARKLGNEKIDVYIKDELSPVVIKAKGMTGVLMPMRLNSVGELALGQPITTDQARAAVESILGTVPPWITFSSDNPVDPTSGRYIRGTTNPDGSVILYPAAMNDPAQARAVVMEELGHRAARDPKLADLMGRLLATVTEAQREAMRELGYGDDVVNEEAVMRMLADEQASEEQRGLMARLWLALKDWFRKVTGQAATDSDLRELLRAAVGQAGTPASNDTRHSLGETPRGELKPSKSKLWSFDYPSETEKARSEFAQTYFDKAGDLESAIANIGQIDRDSFRSVVAADLLERVYQSYLDTPERFNHAERLLEIINQQGKSETAQALQAQKQVNEKLAPYVAISIYLQLVRKRLDAAIKAYLPDGIPVLVKQIKFALESAGKQSADQIAETIARSVGIFQSKHGLADRYGDRAAKIIKSAILAKLGKGAMPDEASLDRFYKQLTQSVLEQMSVGIPPANRSKAKLTLADIQEQMANFAKNPEKYAAVKEKVMAALQDKFGQFPGLEDMVDASLTALSEKAASRAIRLSTDDLKIVLREVMQQSVAAQQTAKNQIFANILKHPALALLSPQEKAELAARLESAWSKERSRLAEAEAKKLLSGKGLKAISAEKLISMANQGLLDDTNVRAIIAQNLGLPTMTDEVAAKLKELSEKASNETSPSRRAKLVNQAMDVLMKAKGINPMEVIRDYWYASALFGFRTFIDVGLGSFMFGTAITMGNSAQMVASGEVRQTALMLSEFIRGLVMGAANGLNLLGTGDYHRLPEFMDSMNNMTDVKSHGADVFEHFWRNNQGWKKLAGAPAITKRMIVALDSIGGTGTRNAAIIYSAFLRKDQEAMAKAEAIADRENAKRAWAQANAEHGTNYAFDSFSLRSNWLDVQRRQREILEEGITEEVLQAATDLGKLAGLNSIPQGIPGHIYRFATRLPWIVRSTTGLLFMRSAMNMADFSSDMIPFWGLGSLARSSPMWVEKLKDSPLGFMMMPDVSPERRRLMIASQAISIMITASLAMLVVKPDDDEDRLFDLSGSWLGMTPKQRSQLMAAGYRPYEIRLPGWKKGISYKNWPIASVLAMVGNLRDKRQYFKEKWDEQGFMTKIGSAALFGAFFIKDVSAMSQISQLLGVSASQSQEVTWNSLNKIAANSVGSAVAGLVPTALKDLDYWFDDKLYRPDGPMEYWVKNFPFVRRTVGSGPALNYLGDPIEIRREPWSRVVSFQSNDPAIQFISKLAQKGIWAPEPGLTSKIYDDSKKREVRMTEAETYEYQAAAKKEFGKQVRANVENLQDMNPEEIKRWLDRISKNINSRSRQAVERKHNGR